MITKVLYLTAYAVLACLTVSAEDTGKASQTSVIPAVPVPQDRALTSVETQELARMEMDFAHGEITESEYSQRKRDMYRSALPKGDALEDGVLNQNASF